jgi:hypothetical protein
VNFAPIDENGNPIGVPIPPWMENSLDAHLFMDWPKFNFETGVLDYTGNTAYGPSNPREDPTTELGKYNDNLDKAWERYLMMTTQGERVSRETWYYGTLGGTVPYDEENVRQYAASKLPTDTETLGGLAEFEKWIGQNKEVTQTQIEWLASINSEAIPWGTGVTGWLKANNTDGWLNVSGMGFQVLEGSNIRRRDWEDAEDFGEYDDWSILRDLDGNLYIYTEEKRWYTLANGKATKIDDPTKG